MSTWVWADGRVTEAGTPVAAGNDPALLAGHGVFTTTSVVGDRPFAPTRHLRRLRASARLAEVEVPWSDDELLGACTDLIAATPPVPADRLGRLRITVSAAARSPLVQLTHAPAWPDTSRVVVVDRPIDDADPLRGAKVVSRLAETLALAEAHRRGADEALRFTRDGHLSEGSASNVFLVLDGRSTTPALSTGCLPGITRELVLELVEVTERDDLTAADLQRAEEAFLTSATRGVHPISHLDGRDLPAPGPVTAAASQAFTDLVTRDRDP